MTRNELRGTFAQGRRAAVIVVVICQEKAMVGQAKGSVLLTFSPYFTYNLLHLGTWLRPGLRMLLLQSFFDTSKKSQSAPVSPSRTANVHESV